MKTAYCDSPVGPLKIVSDGSVLQEISFVERVEQSDEGMEFFLSILDHYFKGTPLHCDVHVKADGTPFQKQVWKQLCTIPYGTTVSYSDIARRFSTRMSAQAIGQAVHNNPVSILIPCHRVIGKNGKLIGYGGGLNRKTFLLDHEKTHSGFDVHILFEEGGVQ
ncbi:MAG: methylated-DNA--[protein]-cysteine S-methyltransferase [Bulleidia sp.]